MGVYSDKQKKWLDLISDYEKSGLTRNKWCAEKNENIHRLQYWQSKFKLEKKEKTENVNFKPLKVIDSKIEHKSDIEIIINGTKIKITNDVDEKLLSKIIKVLKKC